ncbi:hypothetical protein ABFS83_13G049600 [Erythranthe nasuta]
MFQKLDGDEARIADYFDIIAGTETGSVTTAMLTAPKRNNNRPLFAPKDIKEFYIEHFPYIFLQEEKFGDTKLNETLTNVVIPTFDTQPLRRNLIVFSNYRQVMSNPNSDASLVDICMGSLATPSYLPSHYFETKDSKGECTPFNLIGGVVPSDLMVATMKEVTSKGPMQMFGWQLYYQGRSGFEILLILNLVGSAYGEGLESMVLEDVVKIGESLLEKPVSSIYLDSRIYLPSSGEGANKEALIRLAAVLSREKRVRSSGTNKKSMFSLW